MKKIIVYVLAWPLGSYALAVVTYGTGWTDRIEFLMFGAWGLVCGVMGARAL